MLNAVRHGRVTAEIAGMLNTTGARTPPDPVDGEAPIITLATRNDIVNRINRRHLDALTGRAQTAVAEITGDFGRGDASYPADAELQLKVGAQVMFLRNDTASYGEPPRWVNGTIGTVTRISGGTVRVDVDGEEHEVEPAVWERFRYAYDPGSKSLSRDIVAEFTQFPLRLAWAVTIHKSQGKTYDRAIVDLGSRRLRARPDLRRAVAPDLARRSVPLAPAAPERHPGRPRRASGSWPRCPRPRRRVEPLARDRRDRCARSTGEPRRDVRRPGTASRRRGRRRARC